MEKHDSVENATSSNKKRKRRCFENTEQEYEDIACLRGGEQDVVIRVLNMLFNSVDEAEIFYIAYGREIGFDIRTHKVLTIKQTNFIQSVKWVCNREGFRNHQTNELFRQRDSRPETRNGCKACFRVTYHRYSGKYRVTSFEPNHNHDLATTENEHLLRCNRYLTSADKNTMTHLTEIGIRPSKAMDFIQSLVGKLPFTRKDGYNFHYQQRMELIRNGDVNTAFNMLEGMKLHDPGLVLQHTVEADGTLATMFWCDSQSKAEYEAFGDVLVIDSTYKTNTYRFPLVILSGVNNHASNCIFGAGILCDETIPSYRWLLCAFKRAMNGKVPSAVLSDQDASICQAIKDEFPNARHRLCCWHLCRNAKQRVRKGNFACKFVKLAKRNCSVQEFEERWAELVLDYGVADNSWVIDIYEKRAMWSEAYFAGVFMASMSTTQRAESINSLLKLYVKPSLSLTEFIKTFVRAVQQMRRNFVDKQLDDECRKPKARKDSVFVNLEEHAANVCTKQIFKRIRKNILAEQGLIPETNIRLGDRNFIFSFREYKEDKEKHCSVAIDVENDIFHCDCMMLESIGVPCTHILSGFKSMGIVAFPDKSIHPRWLIETGKSLRMLLVESLPRLDAQRTRLGHLYKEFVHICSLLPEDDDSKFTTLMKCVQKISKDMKESKETVNHGRDDTKADFDDGVDPNVNAKYNIRDPVRIKSKGAPMGKKQNCGYCKGSGHNRVTCPKNPANKERYEQVRARTRAQTVVDTPSGDSGNEDGL